MEATIIVKENWLTHRPARNALNTTILLASILLLGTIIYLNNYLTADMWMPASYSTVFIKGQFYRLWTTLLAHAGAYHVLSNLILFLPFAYFLTSYFGFLFFPLGGFLVGGLINLVVLKTMPANVDLIGVSGVVYWMGAAWITLSFLIDKREKIPRRLLRVIGVSLVLFVPDTFEPNVSYLCHLTGYIFGVLSALIYYSIFSRKFDAAEVLEIEYDDMHQLL